MISLEKALSIVDDSVGTRRVPTERIPVREAAGRILSADCVSAVDVPPFNKSAMDGYAVLPDDQHDRYRVVGVVSAGEPGVDTLEPGTTVKVMTGAPVPPPAHRVIRLEEAVEEDGYVRFDNPSAARNICKRAEDIAVGDTILTAGSRIGALEIANLIGGGISEVEVAARIRVAIVSTGDEIVDAPSKLSPGKIMNTNGPLLGELSRRCGLVVVSEEMAPDDPSRLTEVVGRCLDTADVVVLSGGVSVGDFDFVPEAIVASGLEIHFSRVATKPGKPSTFATGERGIFFGLPGNPVAVYLTFHLFVLRAVALLSGSTYAPRELKFRLAVDYAVRSSDRRAHIPCRISPNGFVEPVVYHGSAHLAALMKTDGFIIIPHDTGPLRAGSEVTLITFGGGV